MLNKPQKLCKSCNKQPPMTGRRYCLVCINKKQKELAIEKKTKNTEKMKAKRESINIRLTGVDESDRLEIREKIEKELGPYLGKKQITIKLSHGKVKTELKKYEEKADNLWSKAVKINYNNKCAYSNGTDNLNSHHINTRSRNATRWDIDNGICLTSNHHTFSQKFSAHKTPAKFMNWLIDTKGEKFVQELEKKSRSYCKVTIEYIKEKIQILEEFIANNE